MARAVDDQGRGTSGLLPHVIPARVHDVDDPQGVGRVRVRFHTLPGEPVSAWLRVLTIGGGDRAGLVHLPEPDDEVVVACLHGDPSAGIILGGLHHADALPPEEHASAPDPSGLALRGLSSGRVVPQRGSRTGSDNDRRVWRSRSGHLVLLDDTPGAESVQVRDGSGGLAVVLDGASDRLFLVAATGDVHLRAGGTLHLAAGGDLSLEVGGTLRVAAGAVELRSRGDLSAEADGQASLAGAAGVMVSSRVQAEVQGGERLVLGARMVDLRATARCAIQGGALVEVKAGLITLN